MASDTTATGSTTLLMKRRLEMNTMARHSAATRQINSTASITCRFTSRSEVTSRTTAFTWPLKVRGWDTARIFSPVSGSRPWK